MATYELLKQEGSAKRAVFHTVHGDIQTPVFMNVVKVVFELVSTALVYWFLGPVVFLYVVQSVCCKRV